MWWYNNGNFTDASPPAKASRYRSISILYHLIMLQLCLFYQYIIFVFFSGLYENPLRCKCPLVDIIRTAKTRRLQLIDNPSCKNPVTLRKTFLKDLKLRDVVCDSGIPSTLGDTDTDLVSTACMFPIYFIYVHALVWIHVILELIYIVS